MNRAIALTHGLLQFRAVLVYSVALVALASIRSLAIGRGWGKQSTDSFATAMIVGLTWGKVEVKFCALSASPAVVTLCCYWSHHWSFGYLK